MINLPVFRFFNGLDRLSEFFQKNILSSTNRKVVVVVAAIFAVIGIGVAVHVQFLRQKQNILQKRLSLFQASKLTKGQSTPRPLAVTDHSPSSEQLSGRSSPTEKGSSVLAEPTGSAAAAAADISPITSLSFETLCASVVAVVEMHKQELQAFEDEEQSLIEEWKKYPILETSSGYRTVGSLDESGNLQGRGIQWNINVWRSGEFADGWLQEGLQIDQGYYCKGKYKRDVQTNLTEGIRLNQHEFAQGKFNLWGITSGVCLKYKATDPNFQDLGDCTLLYESECDGDDEISQGKIIAGSADRIILLEGKFLSGKCIRGTKTTFYPDGRTLAEPIDLSF